MKRLLTLVCTLSLLLSFMPMLPVTTASAATYTCGDYSYTLLNDDTARITAFTGYANTVRIPSTLDGHTVSRIGPNAFYSRRDYISEIILPDGVTVIENNAFSGLYTLRAVTLSDKVTSIGSYAFSDCQQLSTLDLPDALTTIGSYAFKLCSSLKYVSLPEGVKTIAPYTFYECNNLSTFYLHEGITSIGASAFSGCWNLHTVYLPKTLRSVGNDAFYGCKWSLIMFYAGTEDDLAAVTNYQTLSGVQCNKTIVRQDGFWYDLKPDGTAAILFYNGTAPHISVPETIKDHTVTVINDYVFSGNSSIASIKLPRTITYIGVDAFTYCYYLHVLHLPAGVSCPRNIADNYTDLRYVTYSGSEAEWVADELADRLPEGATPLFHTELIQQNGILYGVCDGTAAVIGGTPTNGVLIIPNTVSTYPVTSIAPRAFQLTNSLTAVLMDNGVQTIGENAFSECYYLQTLRLPKTVTIGSNAFNAGTLDSTLEYNIYYGGTATDRNALTVGSGNQTLFNGSAWHYEADFDVAEDGTIYLLKNNREATVFAHLEGVTSTVIPDEYRGYRVTEIGDNAFRYNTTLKSITLGNQLRIIDDYAFSNCLSLQSITIPNSVTSIGDGAFHSCTTLQSTSLGNGITVIGNATFAFCTALKSVTIPNGVIGIDGSTFESCTALEDVTIPVSVKTVSDYAFLNCTALQTVYYGGNVEQRYGIHMGVENEHLLNASWQFNAIKTYPDVRTADWYYEAASYVSTRGYMAGFASGNFGPAANMQRQDFVLILARVAGVDLDAYKNKTVTMPDVAAGSYYAPAVAWAVENGVVSGYNNGKFGVGDPITREQVCTILYRFVGSPSVTDVDATLARFPDQASISGYAKIPTAWAVQNGVMSGMASGKMAPVSKASRAQVAVIIMSMDKKGMFDGQ